MFIEPSKRLDLIPPYLFTEISRVKQEALAAGIDIIDLGIGDPDQPTPQYILDALNNAVKNPETHRYDETPRGWNSYLQAAVNWYKNCFNVEINPNTEICQLIGSKEGLAHLAWAYLDEGDISICPNPGYPVYKVNSLMAGGKVYEVPLRKENHFLPILEDIPTEVAHHAKLFYTCYPHNPTGAHATLEFYQDLVQFCKEYKILLVSDMAYSTVCYDGFKNPSVLQVPGAKDIAIEFHSLSKTFNMTGWRLGFALGNADAVSTLQKLKSNIDSKQFPALAEAGAKALTENRNQETYDLYQKRRDILVGGLNKLGWKVESPKTAFYIWAPVPIHGMNSAEFSKRLLQEAHVLTIPGSSYGTEGEGYIRMSLTLMGDQNGERFEEVIQRIKKSRILDEFKDDVM